MGSDGQTLRACIWCLKAVSVNPPCCEKRRVLASQVGEHKALTDEDIAAAKKGEPS